MTPRHIPTLDGVRGVAILAVILVHFAEFTGFLEPRVGAPWLDETYRRVVSYGGTGVTLFFVLSGFLITGILLDVKGTPGAWRNFYARRVLRIFPLYYAVLAFYFVVFPLLRRPVPAEAPFQTWYWAYLSNYWMALHGWSAGSLGHTWSLAVEEQFYLVWPFAVFALTRTALTRLCWALVVFAMALRAAMVLLHCPELYVLATPCQVDALAFGALFSVMVRIDSPWANLRVAGLLFATGLLGILLITVRHGWALALGAQPGDVLAGVSFRSLETISCAGFVLGGVCIRPGALFGRALSTPVLRSLGKYSYGLYLLHVPMGISLRDRGFLSLSRWPLVLGSRLPAVLLLTLAGSVATFAAAWLSWQMLEKRALSLKDRFTYESGAGATGVSA